jgi:hypothetical protein
MSEEGAKEGLKRDQNPKTGSYYSKWDSFSRDANKALDEDDEEEKKESDAALGLDKDEPKSEAQKLDLEKHEALKLEKKKWEKKINLENAVKNNISGDRNKKTTINAADCKGKIVLDFNDDEDCEYVLPSELKLTKIFIANCKNCTFTFDCALVTS